MRLWLTKCSAGTLKAGLARPGRARSAVGISAFLRRICHMARAPRALVSRQYGHTMRANRGGARAMMSFFVCAGLLGLLAVALLSNVGRLRGKTRIFIGDGGNAELITAMRVQANFVENVPLALILIWLVSTFYGAATIAALSVLLGVARGPRPAGIVG